jgi:hypothetical protein
MERGGSADIDVLTAYQAYLPLWLALMKGVNIPRV